MRRAIRLLRLELRQALASRGARLGMLVLFVAGLAALEHGRGVVARQEAALAASPAMQRTEHARILGPLPAGAVAGDQLYYLFFHTHRHPSAWAPVAIGQRDVQPFNLKVRLLALHGQLYDVDLGNPLLAALGHLDLAFVIAVLAPLVLIALTYDVRALEEAQGTWLLLRAQPRPAWRALLTKYAVRALLVWLPLAALQAVAMWRLGLPFDQRALAVAAWTGASLAVWTAVAAGVGALRRSADVNLLALLLVWVVASALGPALVNVAAAARFPLPEGLEITVRQRQGTHGAWDEPLPVVMEAFYTRYPEWRGAEVPTDRYSNPWYYAMQQRGDEAARPTAAAYRSALEARERFVAQAAWLFPPALLQRELTRIARTDLTAHLAYLDSVAAFHERLKRHFLPVVFGDQTVSQVDWSRAPQHQHVD